MSYCDNMEPCRTDRSVTGTTSCSNYYNLDEQSSIYTCMPLKCCGVLKNVRTCLNISTSIPLIISYAAGMNTFLALVYVAYSHIQKNNYVARIDEEMTQIEEGIEIVDDMERQQEG